MRRPISLGTKRLSWVLFCIGTLAGSCYLLAILTIGIPDSRTECLLLLFFLFVMCSCGCLFGLALFLVTRAIAWAISWVREGHVVGQQEKDGGRACLLPLLAVLACATELIVLPLVLVALLALVPGVDVEKVASVIGSWTGKMSAFAILWAAIWGVIGLYKKAGTPSKAVACAVVGLLLAFSQVFSQYKSDATLGGAEILRQVGLMIHAAVFVALWRATWRAIVGRRNAGLSRAAALASIQETPRPSTDFRCPCCGLINPPTAVRCDCGLAFEWTEEGAKGQVHDDPGGRATTEPRCAACGHGLIGTEFKCSACGEWVDDNPVFQKLCESDVKIIKSRDLLLGTPSFLSFQATPFFRQDIERLTRLLGTPQGENGYAYLSAYMHATGLESATRKANRADFLDNRIAIEFIANSLAVALFDIERSGRAVGSYPPVRRSSRDPRVAAGLRAFDLLDNVTAQLPWEIGTADMVGYAKEVGRIVLGHSATLYQGVLLLPMLTTGTKELMPVYEKYFLVDEEDFPWGSIFTGPERRVLEHWLSRFG